MTGRIINFQNIIASEVRAWQSAGRVP